jgi:DNA (cytosine-5)-methyltransferase 1
VTAYYNEIDPFAADWLRELIKQNLIAPGEVDTRSIEDVKPSDLAKFTQCHFFAGIGGWSYALRLAGWPEDKPVWTGSCPCQPFSQAGKGAGFADERHLWPAWFHLVRACRPARIFGEQVASVMPWWDLVSPDLESQGYACGAAVLGAHSVGAPHIRQRLYWMADANGWQRNWLTDGEGRESNRAATGRQQGNREPQCDSSARSLANPNPNLNRCDTSPERELHDEKYNAESCRSLGDTDNAGLEGHRGSGQVDVSQRRQEQDGQASLPSFWSNCEFLGCRDGKARPVEPGTFPLAHGVPARVGRLRGYGNAIVPQVAEAFIRASV